MHIRKPLAAFSLLELLLAVFVAAGIIFAVVRYFNIARENSRVAQATQMINIVIRASYDWLEGKSNFNDLGSNGIQTLVNSNFLPPTFSSATANPWRGTIQVRAASNNQQIQLTLTNVPYTSCVQLSEQLKQQAAQNSANNPDIEPCSTSSNQFVGVF